MDVIKSLAADVLMPLPLALVLSVLGGLLLLLGRRWLGRSLVVLAFVVIFVSAWAPVADRLLEPLEWTYPPIGDPTVYGAVSTVVVLGGGWTPTMEAPALIRLRDSSEDRLTEALRLLQLLPEAGLLVHHWSRDAAIELGVDASRILVLEGPTDTAQEAYAVRDALGEGERFLLVTSASHMRRAMRHFQRVGLEPIPAPTRFKTGRGRGYWFPSAGNLQKTERAIHEYLGLLALELDHWWRD